MSKAFVNSPEWVDFVALIENKISSLKDELSKQDDPMIIYRFQGKIAILKEMAKLREKLNQAGGEKVWQKKSS